MAFTRNWQDGVPIGTEQASDLDTFIQNVRGDISDRIKNMVYGFVAGENTLSQHFQYLQFYEQASVAQPSAGYGRLYCKAVGGKCEFFWQDEDGDEIQLTTGGNFGGGNLELLAGMDLLGSATSDITINTNKFTVAGATGNTVIAGTLTQQGVATLADTSALATSGAPAADAQIVNKKYVDDQISAIQDPAYSGGESHTFDGGLIMKMGVTASIGANSTGEVTYGTAFPNGVISAQVTIKGKYTSITAMSAQPKSGSETSILEVSNSFSIALVGYWIVIGH